MTKKDNRGGSGRGQGRKPLPESLVSKTITIFERHAERLKDANLSAVIRRLLDEEELRRSRRVVTLWEDNSGGCWLVDPERNVAWSMGQNGAWGHHFVTDADALLFGDTDHWPEEIKFSYAEAIEDAKGVLLVSEWDGTTAALHVTEMGYGAREYCRVPNLD